MEGSARRELMDLLLLDPAERVDKCKRWLEEYPYDQEDRLIVQRVLEQSTKFADQLEVLEQSTTFVDKLEAMTDKLEAMTDKVAALTFISRAELDAKIEDRYAKMSKLDPKMSKLDAQIAELNAQIDDRNAKLEALSLAAVARKYPAMVDRTDSGPHYPEGHGHAKVLQHPIGDTILSSVNELMDKEFMRSPCVIDKNNNCDSEWSVLSLIETILRSVVEGLKLQDVIQIVANRGLAGVHCDVLLVYKPIRLPFAVLEAKKPGSFAEDRRLVFYGKDDENLVAGEIYDEMMAVKLFGFKQVFGMITTGNQWRLTSLGRFDNCKRDLTALGLESIRNQLSDGGANSPYHKSSPETSGINNQDEVPPVETKRQIYASQIIPQLPDDDRPVLSTVKNSGRTILQLLTLFVLKACGTLCDLLDDRGVSLKSIVAHTTMPCRILSTKKDSVIAFGSISFKNPLTLDNYISEGQTIFVIHHLGKGVCGNCCLGVDATGTACCAIKFYQTGHEFPSTEFRAKYEFDNWEKVYGKQTILPMCRILQCGKESYCLVMPYLDPVDKADRQGLLQGGQIEAVLRKFAASKYIHNDIKWRHFGWWKKCETLFLMDLGNIEAAKNSQEIEKWVNASLHFLESTSGTKQATTPDTKPSGSKRKRRAM